MVGQQHVQSLHRQHLRDALSHRSRTDNADFANRQADHLLYPVVRLLYHYTVCRSQKEGVRTDAFHRSHNRQNSRTDFRSHASRAVRAWNRAETRGTRRPLSDFFAHEQLERTLEHIPPLREERLRLLHQPVRADPAPRGRTSRSSACRGSTMPSSVSPDSTIVRTMLMRLLEIALRPGAAVAVEQFFRGGAAERDHDLLFERFRVYK